jgi:hypothetical protein
MNTFDIDRGKQTSEWIDLPKNIQYHGIQFSGIPDMDMLSVEFNDAAGHSITLPILSDGTVIMLPGREWQQFRLLLSCIAKDLMQFIYELQYPVEQHIEHKAEAADEAMKFKRVQDDSTATEKRRRGSLYDLGGKQ